MNQLVINETFKSNTYLVYDSDKHYCIIIDPGLDFHLIEEKLIELNLIPKGIIATHGHFDHIGSAAHFQKIYNIPFYLHKEDYKLSQSANFFLKVSGVNKKIVAPKPDYLINTKAESIVIANFLFETYNFKGHTNGSIAIKFENTLYTGDLFYKKGLGFNGFPGENPNELRKSINEIFEKFNEDFHIYPGHGSSALLGSIKRNNQGLNNFLKNCENI